MSEDKEEQTGLKKESIKEPEADNNTATNVANPQKPKPRRGLSISKNLYYIFGAVLIVAIIAALFLSGALKKQVKKQETAPPPKETSAQYLSAKQKAQGFLNKAQQAGPAVPQQNSTIPLPPMSPETKNKIKKLGMKIKNYTNNYAPEGSPKETLAEKAAASPMVSVIGQNNYNNSSSSFTVNKILNQQNNLQKLQNKAKNTLNSIPDMENKALLAAKEAQLEKTNPNQAFLLGMKQKEENYQKVLVSQKPVSGCEVEAGTIIPAVLISKINSNLPGFIKAETVNNVYSYNGECLEIPKGSFLIGMYSSQVTTNQSRLLVAFKTLELPSGRQLNLLGMPGMTGNGIAGFHDLVNTHFWTMFGTSLLLSFINVGSQAYGAASGAMAPSAYGTTAPVNAAGIGESTVSNTAGTLGQNMLSKYANIPPTLIIRQGYRFNVFVSKNMVLPEVKNR